MVGKNLDARAAGAFFRQPVLWLLAVLLAACLGSAYAVYRVQWTLPLPQLFAAPTTLPIEALIFQNNTLPRMLMALCVGGALSVCSVLLQQVMNNPLASDSTLAVSSGAQTALLLSAVFAPSLLAYGSGAIAFAGAMAALGLVLWLSLKRGMAPLMVVLSGLVMSLYLSAVSGGLVLFYNEETRGMALWEAGSLFQDGWYDVGRFASVCAAVFAVIALLVKPLNVMSLSDEQAVSLGIPVKQIRLAALAAAALISAYVVSLVGMMGFIGLAAAAAVRQLGVRTLIQRLCAGFAVGALLLWLTDNLLMLLAFYRGVDLPAGTVTALIGAPLLLTLMLRSKMPSAPDNDSRRSAVVKRYRPWLLVLLLAAVLAASLLVGQSHEGWYVSADSDVLGWRYPRVLMSVAGGVMLAVAGVLLQRLTQNPMASPELLGISSGTSLGVMTAVLLFGIVPGSLAFWLSGGVSALLTLLAILLLNRKSGMLPEKILLTGMAVAALSGAFMRVWAASGDLRLLQMQVWLSGSTYQAEAAVSGSLLAAALLFFAAVLPLQRWLGLLGLNSVIAQAGGVPVAAARAVLVLLAAVLTALATLMLGPLSFIGLLAPHLATMLGARLPVQQLLGAALIGATVMLFADWIGRQIMFPYEIPAGIVATVLGGAYFLYMMRKM